MALLFCLVPKSLFVQIYQADNDVLMCSIMSLYPIEQHTYNKAVTGQVTIEM